jgi:hypothetical protein
MALGRALRQQGSESLARNHPRDERPELTRLGEKNLIFPLAGE